MAMTGLSRSLAKKQQKLPSDLLHNTPDQALVRIDGREHYNSASTGGIKIAFGTANSSPNCLTGS